MLSEYDGNNNLLRKYIYGPGIDQPVSMIEVADANAVYYYHFDALGSVVALSDAAGDTVQTYEYSVYGEVAVEDANHTNPYMFAGVRYDIEIGLYYNRARYYNPFTGRFLQTDPIGYGAGMNLYAYCGNNPVGFTDPDGLKPVTEEDFEVLHEYARQLMLNTLLDVSDDYYVTDVEAMARIADAVSRYTGSEPCDVNDFVDVLSRLLCYHTYGRGDGNWLPHRGNDEMVTGFRDTGFKDIYREHVDEASNNQVNHFVAFLQAGYYGGYAAGVAYAWYHEDFKSDNGDFRLGERGAWLGEQLAVSADDPFDPANMYNPGISPSGVGNWIRANLAE